MFQSSDGMTTRMVVERERLEGGGGVVEKRRRSRNLPNLPNNNNNNNNNNNKNNNNNCKLKEYTSIAKFRMFFSLSIQGPNLRKTC